MRHHYLTSSLLVSLTLAWQFHSKCKEKLAKEKSTDHWENAQRGPNQIQSDCNHALGSPSPKHADDAHLIKPDIDSCHQTEQSYERQNNTQHSKLRNEKTS
jgi:hypothetical protein